MFNLYFIFLTLCHHAPQVVHHCIHFNPAWAHYLATHPGARICKG